MKGVILAGGLGTRLYPLTRATNKHLLPIYDEPMIFYPIRTLVNAGIDEILIVVSGPYSGHFISIVKNGKQFGLDHLEYAYQNSPDGGIADALKLAEDFSDGGPITVILGDNTTDANIKKVVKKFEKGATVFLKKVPDPQRFGVPTFDPTDKKKIIKITEKPKKPDSDFAITGLYIYDGKVFDYIRECRPSSRGQLEITDVNNLYIRNKQLNWARLDGYWLDAGTFGSLLAANVFWAEKKKCKALHKIVNQLKL